MGFKATAAFSQPCWCFSWYIRWSSGDDGVLLASFRYRYIVWDMQFAPLLAAILTAAAEVAATFTVQPVRGDRQLLREFNVLL